MHAGVAAAQQMMSSPEDLQQLLQAQAAAAQQQPSLQDWSANAELLNQLQHMQQVLTGFILPTTAHSCLSWRCHVVAEYVSHRVLHAIMHKCDSRGSNVPFGR